MSSCASIPQLFILFWTELEDDSLWLSSLFCSTRWQYSHKLMSFRPPLHSSGTRCSVGAASRTRLLSILFPTVSELVTSSVSVEAYSPHPEPHFPVNTLCATFCPLTNTFRKKCIFIFKFFCLLKSRDVCYHWSVINFNALIAAW